MDMSNNELKVENLNGEYARIADIFGIEVALEFYKEFNGQQITYPRKLYNEEYVMNMVMKEYDGSLASLRKLARQYEYSEGWLRKKIKQKIMI